VAAGGDAVAVPADVLRAGALDYVVKDPALTFMTELPKRVGESVTRHRLQDLNRLLIESLETARDGIGIRAPLEGDAAYKGMEIQILDYDAPIYKGRLKPAQYHGSIYDVIPAKTGFLKPTGQWNSEEITANGRQITVITRTEQQ